MGREQRLTRIRVYCESVKCPNPAGHGKGLESSAITYLKLMQKLRVPSGEVSEAAMMREAKKQHADPSSPHYIQPHLRVAEDKTNL